MTSPEIAPVETALQFLREGKMVIIIDDEQRENEGDFAFAADFVTPEKINFLAKFARGLICIAAPRERIEELELQPMVMNNTSHMTTNFTVSVDIKNGGTGISAKDRSDTCRVFVDPNARPTDLARPGHIFPLGARDGGVLVRAGHTEAVVDLCKLAGLSPVGVICEILNDDGTMARLADLKLIAREHNMPIVAIRDLIAYRTQHEQLVKRVVTTKIPNQFGLWNMHLYENLLNNEETIVLEMGEPAKQPSALVRVHSKCFTGDTFHSFRCDCGPQLDAAMARIAEEGHGVIVYMDQEGRGIGLRAKMQAYNLQDNGRDTVDANIELGYPADLREYGIGAQILRDLGLKRIRVMTNNPKKIIGIKGFGLEVEERVALTIPPNPWNEQYMRTKEERMGHDYSLPKEPAKSLRVAKCSNGRVEE
ncbi:MAG: bifunctional 3,4-dihydroxy-2-butanone-4-phosphate synthase/GTP cyclohydrolase II [Candidatus Sumerlaeia bacterium]|nr:bifunctional 3,4-dihydroxy-2-butanone-4-phosphate synthase/GTP cyclohydrolase II [Candidatus Sumerlaeia bacterium]